MLYRSANSISEDVKLRISNDRDLLEAIANIISGYDAMDSPEVKQILGSYVPRNMVSRIELLLPGDTVLLSDGTAVDVRGKMSFGQEAALKDHITDRNADISDESRIVVRSFVPVTKNGETAAMLYGVIELDSLPQLWETNVYGGNAAIYIIDTNTGDFIVDTWHKSLGNVLEFGSREMKKGYDQAQFRKNVMAGNMGYTVFVSQTIGENLYFYYEPVGINRWSVGISVSESVAFRNAQNTRNLLWLFVVVECVLFLAYFVWMMRNTKKEMYEKQKRLEVISYIYEVEKLLFVAHQKKENIRLALQRIAQMIAAKTVFFTIFEEEGKEQFFYWSETEQRDAFFSFLEENQYFKGYLSGTGGCTVPDDVIVIPVRDINHSVIGALGCMNVKERWDIRKLLEHVELSFSMFYNNLHVYRKIKEMGENDSLTGLKNRNCFEQKLSQYPYLCKRKLACIYVDVNGLHDLNNNNGHAEGDKMLHFIASVLKEKFGEEDTYRIGGDEFAAFAIDEDMEDIKQKVREFSGILEEEGYHASIGAAERKKPVISMDELVKAAEKIMYEEKTRYYQQNQIDRRKGKHEGL